MPSCLLGLPELPRRHTRQAPKHAREVGGIAESDRRRNVDDPLVGIEQMPLGHLETQLVNKIPVRDSGFRQSPSESAHRGVHQGGRQALRWIAVSEVGFDQYAERPDDIRSPARQRLRRTCRLDDAPSWWQV